MGLSLMFCNFVKMKKILEIFKGDNGQLSSKRFVGIIGAFVLFGTMAHNSMSCLLYTSDAADE